MYKLNSSDSLLKQPTLPASEPSPPEPEQLRQIAAKIEGLRSTSTMYLDLRPLLLEMWTVIVQMQAQLDEQNRK